MSFDLDAYLLERKQLIEDALFCLIPSDTPPLLAEAMSHALQAGGKRIRPILCLASAESVGGLAEEAMPAALAVELLHNYTLVHDDLPCMDNDEIRRGKPSVWKKYGETIAVLAGDALQALAFRTLSNVAVHRHGVMADLFRDFALFAGSSGVIGGQVVDTQYEGHPTRDGIDYVFQHKTADLFCAACRMGGMIGGGTLGQVAALHDYAEHLGFAFQIEDDLLDAEEAKADDKPELSCLDLMSTEEARAWSRKETELALDALDSLPGDTIPLRELAIRMIDRKV